jgi:hypothetical protein
MPTQTPLPVIIIAVAVLCSVIIIAVIIIAIEIAFSIETIVTIELIMVSITVITLELGVISIFANEAVHDIEMSISCRGCWGIRSAQLQGEIDGSDVTGRDVSWEMTEKRVRHGMVFPIGPVSKEFLFPGRWRKIRFVKGRRQTNSHDDYVAGIDVPWKDNIRCGIFRHVWSGIGGFSLWRGRCNQTRHRKRKIHTGEQFRRTCFSASTTQRPRHRRSSFVLPGARDPADTVEMITSASPTPLFQNFILYTSRFRKLDTLVLLNLGNEFVNLLIG